MAIIFMEGFGQCAEGTDQLLFDDPGLMFNWDAQLDQTPNNPHIVALEDGSSGIRKYITGFTDPSSQYLEHALQELWGTAAGKTVTIGFRLWLDSTETGVSEYGIMELGDIRMYIGVDASGKVGYGYGSSHETGSSFYATSAAVPTDQWVYVEIELVLQTSATGTCNIYLDGGLDSSNTNVQTLSTAANDDFLRIALGVATNGLNSRPGTRITDIYVTDGEVLGPQKVYYQPCDTAGTNANFTPSAGLNHQNVDDQGAGGADGDTTYNESTLPGNVDSFTHSDAIGASIPINAVEAVAVLRCPAGHASKARVGIDSGTAVYGGTEQVFEGTQYVNLKTGIQETDPNTAAAWTESGLNAAETVIEHVA